MGIEPTTLETNGLNRYFASDCYIDESQGDNIACLLAGGGTSVGLQLRLAIHVTHLRKRRILEGVRECEAPFQ